MNPISLIKPYLWGGAILIVLGLFLSIFWLRDSLQDAKTEAAMEKAAKVQAVQTISSIQKNAAADHKLLEGYQSVKTEIQYVDKIVTKEVIRYRERVVNRCELSPDWVRIHDQSAAGVHSADAATGANDATGPTPKAIDDAIALEVVTSNNRTCIADQEKLKALQAWASRSRQSP